MKENYVFVVDVGSSKLRAMVAGRGLNNTFKEKAYKERGYDGFFEGEFLNRDSITSFFEEVTEEFGPFLKKINKVYIGVPAEFSSVMVEEASLNLGDKARVTQGDIDSLVYMASEKSKTREVEVITVKPISYRVDGVKTNEPIGESGVTFSSSLSIVYASKDYINFFNGLIGSLGFSSVEYISEVMAEAHFILPKENREELTLLVDSGDITTSIALAQGEGVKMLMSVSRGGGFVTNDLAEAFELSIEEAERLKSQIVLSLKGGKNDYYELAVEGKTERILLSLANEVVAFRVEELAEVISKCLQAYSQDYIQYLPVYLTGGGISSIKGARDYLAKCLGRNISFGYPRLPGKEKPSLSSIYSLTSWALNSEEGKN